MSSSPEEPGQHSNIVAQRSRLVRGLLLSLKVFGALVVAVAMIVGTATALIAYQGKRAPVGNHEYVALGSSFGAGPGVPNRDPASPVLCMRSDNNYPHQLARLRRLGLTDVTCSGATTLNILHGGQFFQPPQLDAVGDSTRLVTITAGGDDIRYLPDLAAWSCAKNPGAVSLSWRRRICALRPGNESENETVATQVGISLQEIGREAHRRAPHATVVFVDYMTVLPDTGYCPDRLPITDAQADRARFLATTLAAKTKEAAQATQSLFVSAAGLTRRHDMCSADPWVYGYTFPATPLNYGPIAFHPTSRAMTAIAAGINKALTGR